MSKEDEIRKLREALLREQQERKVADLEHALRLDVVEQNQTEINNRFEPWAKAMDDFHKAYKAAHDSLNLKLAAYRAALAADRQMQYQVISFIAGTGLGWIGSLVKNLALNSASASLKVQQELVGNVQGLTKTLVEGQLKSVLTADPGKGEINVVDPVTMLRDIAGYVRHVKTALQESIAAISKDPAKHLSSPPGKTTAVSSREDWLRSWLEAEKWDYAAAKAKVASLVAAQTNELIGTTVKQDPKPPSVNDMATRIEKTMWVHWIANNYKKELNEGYPIPRFQRLDELFVSAGILKPENAPRIYRGERIDSAGSPYGDWRRRRESEVWAWSANWLQSPESRIAFSPKGKETAVYMREIQDQIARSARQSLAMQMNVIRTFA